jgi:alkyl sulfatase BDS1-like metallo-beta-lactamase superfamily hydrolase
MADLLALSSRIIDTGVADEPVNRVTHELSELADNLAMVESFSHVIAWRSEEGLVCFDTSAVNTGAKVVESLRHWSTEPFHSLVYTHGHVDHVGGCGAFVESNVRAGLPSPHIIGHRHVERRFDRYRSTNDWNRFINRRQFGGVRGELDMLILDAKEHPNNKDAHLFLAADVARPTQIVDDFHATTIGDELLEFHHGRGETDDHLWTWFPNKKWLASGDFVIWNFPNAGNPQKVQRWPVEWAATLRKMIAKGPELLLPAHGLPIEGKERIAMVLDDIASALETLVDETVTLMNQGANLVDIVHTVKVPDATLRKPYMRPFYDEPEFVVRNIWRQFGGWWDGAASRLKPSRDHEVGAEIAHLAGGADVLIARAVELAEAGDLRLACHLADFAGWAAPDDPDVHEARARVYELRRKAEPSLMSKGIFRSASRESEAIAKRARDDN